MSSFKRMNYICPISWVMVGAVVYNTAGHVVDILIKQAFHQQFRKAASFLSFSKVLLTYLK